MYKKHTVIIEDNEHDYICSNKLKVGEMGIVSNEHAEKNHVVMRTYDNIVSLDNPNLTWRIDSTLKVRRVLHGTRITIIVDGG